MKKPLLILLCLIGLSAFNQASAQSDLDIVNNTGCKYLVHSGDLDLSSCMNSGLTNTTTVIPGAVLTVIHTPLPYQVVKVGVMDCSGVNFATLWDLTPCGFGNNLTAIIPATACCPTGASLIFTPATATTNAVLTIN